MSSHTTMAYPDTPAAGPKRGILRHAPTAARILFGAAFVLFGLNGFLNFIPPPKEPMPAGAMAFSTALVASGYMMSLIGGTQLIAGLLLLLNRFVPLALALLAPFLVNSIAFHLFLAPTGLSMALLFVALELYLAWEYRDQFRPMLAARNRPKSQL